MKKKKNGMAYAYLAPTLITILLVTCLPILYTVILSFTNYNMYHLGDYTFVGADNYLTVFSGSIKSVFFPVLGWTICFAIFSTVGSYAMGLLLAILLNNPHMKESKIYRAILVLERVSNEVCYAVLGNDAPYARALNGPAHGRNDLPALCPRAERKRLLYDDRTVF